MSFIAVLKSSKEQKSFVFETMSAAVEFLHQEMQAGTISADVFEEINTTDTSNAAPQKLVLSLKVIK